MKTDNWILCRVRKASLTGLFGVLLGILCTNGVSPLSAHRYANGQPDSVARGRLAPVRFCYELDPVSGTLQIEVENQSQERVHMPLRASCLMMHSNFVRVICRTEDNRVNYETDYQFYNDGEHPWSEAPFFKPGQTRIYCRKVGRDVNCSEKISWEQVVRLELYIDFQYFVSGLNRCSFYDWKDIIPVDHKTNKSYRIEMKYEADFPTRRRGWNGFD